MNTNGRKRIGLALSGGVARGTVHIGVLSVLDEAGIPIDYIAGTSAGSLVGAAYCAGVSIAEIKELAQTTGWRTMVNFKRPRHGLISFDKMEAWMEELVGEIDIRDLSIPFTAVTTDMTSGETVLLHEGSLSKAVRASCSVPGVIEPVEWDGRLLGDGGVSNNLPVDVAHQMGADYVIAVDLFTPDYINKWGPLGSGIIALETLIWQSGGGHGQADCLIKPALKGHNYLNFAKSKEYIAAGEAAARDALPQIRAALRVANSESMSLS